MPIYKSEFPGATIDARLAAVATMQTAISNLETALAAKYSKPANGIPETDMDAAVQSALAKARSAVQDLSNFYTKAEIDALLAAVDSSQYVDVPALPTASADTLGKIYLVGPDANNQYARYYTSYDGSVYSWVPFGTTEINLANYATKDALARVAQKVDNIEVVNEPTDKEEVEFLNDDGTFIAKVSPDGIESKDFIVRDGAKKYTLKYLSVEDEVDDELALGDDNGKNVVLFSEGHIRTKNFDSKKIKEAIEQIETGQGLNDVSWRVRTFLEDYLSYRFGKQSWSWYERFRLMHFSDTHVNMTNLGEALNLSVGRVHAVLDTGDNANSITGTPSSTTIAELNRYATLAGSIDLTSPLVICNGNHDVPEMTKQQYFDVMCELMSEKSPAFVFGDSTHFRTYGYIDLTPNATIGTIRIVTLDPFDYADGQYMNPYGQTGAGGWMNCVFSQTQINWLIATLRAAASNGYKVITTMHYSFGDNPVFSESGSADPDANFHQDPFMIPDIIDAMQRKATLSASYPDDEGINNIVIDEDFSDIGDIHFVCHLFGHIHSENEYRCQKTDGSKFYNILMVGAPNMGSEGYAINKVPLQPATLNSIKLTVLEIDTVEKAIYRINYGAFKAYDMSIVARTKKIPYTFND